ncbi:MAG: hypothetical protein V3U74_05120 [Thermodesulfobacteriota bacterium]
MEQENKQCFVICPLGKDNSEIREESELVMELVIKPAAEACGYDARRAIDLNIPATLTNMIISEVINAPILIADLTSGNPNVLYELAIRHAAKKPAIQIIRDGEQIPFDVKDQNTIEYAIKSKRKRNEAIIKIIKQIKSSEADPTINNPITIATTFEALAKSSDPVEKGYAEIMNRLEEIKNIMLSTGEQEELNAAAIDNSSAGFIAPSQKRASTNKAD